MAPDAYRYHRLKNSIDSHQSVERDERPVTSSSSILELPTEILVEIVDAGQFSRRRLRALRSVHRIFAELLAPRILHTITRPLFPFDAVKGASELELAHERRERIKELTTAAYAERIRKCAKRLWITVDGNYPNFTRADISAMDWALPGLVDVHFDIRMDEFAPDPPAASQVAYLMSALSEPAGRSLHVSMQATMRTQLSRCNNGTWAERMMLPTMTLHTKMYRNKLLAALPASLASLKIIDESGQVNEPAMAAAISRSEKLASLSFRTYSIGIEKMLAGVLSSENVEALDHVTALEVLDHASPGCLSKSLLAELPNLHDFSTDVVGDAADEAWTYFNDNNIGLKTLRASSLTVPLFEFLGSSPTARNLRVLDINLDSAVCYSNSRDYSTADEFWGVICGHLSDSLEELSATIWDIPERAENVLGVPSLLHRASAWSLASESVTVLPRLKMFNGILVYSSLGCFDQLIQKLHACRRVNLFVLSADFPNLNSTDAPAATALQADWDSLQKMSDPEEWRANLYSEIESGAWDDTFAADTELRVEVVSLPYDWDEPHWSKEYVFCRAGYWEPLGEPAKAAAFNDRHDPEDAEKEFGVPRDWGFSRSQYLDRAFQRLGLGGEYDDE